MQNDVGNCVTINLLPTSSNLVELHPEENSDGNDVSCRTWINPLLHHPGLGERKRNEHLYAVSDRARG